MATVQSSPYPSYEEIRSNYQSVVFCDDFKRLFWPLEGVFPERFAVMKSRKGALEAMEPFLQSDGTWHEIASLPLTEPKISSVMASVPLLDEYEAHWAYFHELHDEAEFVTYGDLEDEQRPYAQEQKEDGSWEEDSDTKYLARCCGQDRPLNKWNKKLKVLPSPGKDFVSVYDYVSGMLFMIFPKTSISRPFLTVVAYSGTSLVDEFTRGYYRSIDC